MQTTTNTQHPLFHEWAQLMVDEHDEYGSDPFFRDFCRGSLLASYASSGMTQKAMAQCIDKSSTYVGRMLRYWRFLCYLKDQAEKGARP